MSKRQKKKAPVVEEEPEVEVITKTEYIYEDTKCISGVEPEYQWGEIYRLITCQHREIFIDEDCHKTRAFPMLWSDWLDSS